MKRTDEQMIAYALEIDPILLPRALELLTDLEELGSDSASIVKLIRSLGIGKPASVVDLGCGKGATAIAIASELGLPVLGIDLFEPFVQYCRQAAASAGVNPLCSFQQGNILDLAGRVDPAEVAVFAALGDVLGTPAETMAVLRRYVKPGGFVLVSDAYLRDGGRPGPPGYEHYQSPEDTRKGLTAWGDVIVREAIDEDDEESAEDSNASEAAALRRRAHQIALRHPELEVKLKQYADSQAEAYEYIDQNLIGAVWALRRV